MGTSGFAPECVNCGTRLPSGALRCPMCGAPAGKEYRQRRCPQCGTPAAARAQTCLMCRAPLDTLAIRGGLAGVSWSWIGAVALIAALVALGWNYWRNQAPAAALAPAAAAGATHTPAAVSTLTPASAPIGLAVTPTPTPTGTPSPIPSTPQGPSGTPTPIVHQVQPGDTVSYIASYYGTTIEVIMEANGLDETSARRLRVGQELLVPAAGPVGGPAGGMAAPPQVIHEVQSGETLIYIANAYDTTVDAIIAANDMSAVDLIYPGQELIVPLMPPTATATLTPTPTPSSTPGPPYDRPQLLSPPDGAVFESRDAAVLLSWASVSILRSNQAYLVELDTPARTEPLTYTTQGTSWRLPLEFWPTGRLRTLTWRVTVVEQRDGASSDQMWNPLSSPSETRHFLWQ